MAMALKFLELLKKQNKTEGVIIISAKDTLETKIEGLTLGADDYLTKPFHLSRCASNSRHWSDENNLMEII